MREVAVWCRAAETSIKEERQKMQAALDAAILEREQLAQRLAEEEAHMRAELSKKLTVAKKEKVDLEAACEMEQEYLVNRAQKQLQSVCTCTHTL